MAAAAAAMAAASVCTKSTLILSHVAPQTPSISGEGRAISLVPISCSSCPTSASSGSSYVVLTESFGTNGDVPGRHTSLTWRCLPWERCGPVGCGNLNLSSRGIAKHLDFAAVRLSRKKCRLSVVCQASRDMVLDFGKFKGSMLGTMSSKYLKWMAKNLKNGPMSEWSEYAEEVLADPHYEDRREWEKVEKLMTVGHDVNSITGNRDVLAPARIFGWDLEDDSGWRRVNFSLLGTTKGGRIPRVTGAPPPVGEKKREPRKKPATIRTTRISLLSSGSSSTWEDSSSSGSLRDELMRRRARRREKLKANRRTTTDGDEQQRLARFPGRDSLLSTVRSYDISE